MNYRLILLLVTILGLGLTQPHFFEKTSGRELVSPPSSLQYFTFGNREVMADLFWIRAIQDFDYCEEKLAEQLCKGNGWLAKTLLLITDLSKHFRMAYSAGGIALTVIISDYAGASLLFDKGVVNLPNDWVIAYKAAYHALFEEQNKGKAAELMAKAAQNGAPEWVYLLSTRLYTEAGKKEMATRLVDELERSNFDKSLLEVMKQKLSQKASP